MGLIQKKEEHDVIEGIEIIERSEEPDDLPKTEVDLIAGKSAEDIAAESDDAEADDSDKDDADASGAHFSGASSASDEKDADKKRKHGKKKAESSEKRPKAASGGSDGSDGTNPPASGDGSDKTPGKRNNMAIGIAVAVIAVIVAAVIGYFVGSGGFSQANAGATASTLTEDQLDTVVASWTYKGASSDITARQLIESQYSLDAVKNDDGTYPTPTADAALSYVRNQILLSEADSRGITVSEDEMTEFAEERIGSSDYASLAEQYNLSEDQAKEVVRQQATMQKLYDQVVPATTASVPTAPTEPEDGDTSTRSQDYATYIIGLAGDEWDAEANTWASEDGAFYQALSGTDFTADSASYEEALTAYYTAYQQYAQQSNEASATWTEFENALFAEADVNLYGLFA